jgi:hypothetical protein
MSNEIAPQAPESNEQVQPPELEALKKASEGLTFPSETDAPFTPFFWKAEAVEAPSADLVATQTQSDAGEIRSQSLATLFRPLIQEEDWHNDEEKAEVARFQELLKALKSTLKQPKVFRVGKIEVDIYIVGCVSGGYAGLKTQAVET